MNSLKVLNNSRMASFQGSYTPAKNQRDKKPLQRSRWDFLRRHQSIFRLSF